MMVHTITTTTTGSTSRYCYLSLLLLRRHEQQHPVVECRRHMPQHLQQRQLRLLQQQRTCLLYHRCFTTNTDTATTSTSTTTTIATKHQQQQKKVKNKATSSGRKRKLLASTSSSSSSSHKKKHIVTTKDKIRLLMETNQSIPNNRFHSSVVSVAPAKDLLDLAQSRLSYVRNSLYQYWNPDYTEEPPITTKSSSSSSSSSSSTEPQSLVRTYKAGLVIMDTRWWTWNILLALMPAIGITIYCELRGKPMMYEYHHQLEVQQLRNILGENEFTTERADAIIAARNKDRDQNESTAMGDIDEIIYKYIKKFSVRLYQTMQDTCTHVWEDVLARMMIYTKHDRESTIHVDETTTTTTTAVDIPVVVVHGTNTHGQNDTTSNTVAPERRQQQEQQSVKEDTTPILFHPVNKLDKYDEQKHTETNHHHHQQQKHEELQLPEQSKAKNDTNLDPSIEYLLHRLQEMEELIRQQQQQQQPQSQSQSSLPTVPSNSDETVVEIVGSDDTDEAIRMIGQRMKHMNQSNVQNRFEIDSKQKWHKYIVQNDDHNRNDNEQLQPNQNIKDKKSIGVWAPMSLNSIPSNNSGNRNSPIDSEDSSPSPSGSDSSTYIKQFLHPYAILFFQTVGWLQDGNSNSIHESERRDHAIDDESTIVADHMQPPLPTSQPIVTTEEAATIQPPTIIEKEVQQYPTASSVSLSSSEIKTPETTNNNNQPQQQKQQPWWKRFWC